MLYSIYILIIAQDIHQNNQELRDLIDKLKEHQEFLYQQEKEVKDSTLDRGQLENSGLYRSLRNYSSYVKHSSNDSSANCNLGI